MKKNIKKIDRGNCIKTVYLFSTVFSWTLLLVSVLVLSYIYYRSEILHLGEFRDRYIKYYIISFFAIFFSFVLLKLKKNLRFNVILFAGSLLSGIYLTEFFLIAFKKTDLESRAEIAGSMGINFDTRTRLQVVQDMVLNGVDAVPTIHPHSFLPHKKYQNPDALFPLSGVSKKVTIYSNENGKYAVYMSDRYGFNNPDSEWDSPQLKWLLTGDSFTHGSAVQQGEDIASKIRLMTDESAINLGIGGNGPLIELAILKEYAEFLRPEKVIWLYYEGNDLISNLSDEKNNPVLIQYLQNGFSQNLINRQQYIDQELLNIIERNKTRNFIPDWMRLSQVLSSINSYLKNKRQDVADFEIFRKILNSAKNRVEEWGGEFYFIYLPEFYRYNTIVDHDLYRKKHQVIGLVRDLGIPVVDIHEEVFSENPDPLSFFPLRIFGHYTAEGYHQVAESIVKSIQ